MSRIRPGVIAAAALACLLGVTQHAFSQAPAPPPNEEARKAAEAKARAKAKTRVQQPAVATPHPATELVTPAGNQQTSGRVAPFPERVTPKAELSDQVLVAKQAQTGGRYREAAQAYEQELGKPDAPPAARTAVQLAYAQTLEQWSKQEPDAGGDRLGKAEALYRASIESGDRQQRQLARNNLGALQIQQGKYGEALATMTAVEAEADPASRFAYTYNLGRAYELNGKPMQALDHYLKALDAQPAFAPPREAALQLIQSQAAPRAEGARRLTSALLSRGQSRTAGDVLRALLKEPSADDVAPLLGLLMQTYVSQAIDLASFQEREVPFLESIPRSGASRQLSGEMTRAMLDQKLPVIVRADQWRRVFPMWSMERNTKDLSAFMKYAGDLHNRSGRYQQALARYLGAWAFDDANGDAAVYAAMIIQAHPEIDRDRVVLNALVNGIFDAKSDYILANDWPNSLRTHIVLAGIFEQLGQWGPIGNPRTAAYQWKAALDDEQRILRTDKSFGRSPGLYTRLAECYQRLGSRREARDLLLKAATVFEQTGRTNEASEMRQRASAVM